MYTLTMSMVKHYSHLKTKFSSQKEVLCGPNLQSNKLHVLPNWGLLNKARLMSLKYQEAYRHIDKWLRNTIRYGLALLTQYTAYTVDTVCTNQTALHCLNISM